MKYFIGVILVVILAAGGLGGRKLYREWRTKQALIHAQRSFNKSDYNAGLIWLRKALKSDGRNVEAVRMMAEFSESVQSAASVSWRQRLLELQPTLTNRLGLARVGMLHRQYEMARASLENANEEEKDSVEIHLSLGAISVAQGATDIGRAHFLQALKKEPQNSRAKLNLAMIQVQDPDQRSADEGQAILEQLLTNNLVRADALRHLAFNAFRKKNHAKALDLSAELNREPGATLEDRLLQLNLLIATTNRGFETKLAEHQRAVSTNSQSVFGLARWMLGIRGPLETLNWLESLPKLMTTNLPVALVVADTYLGTTNWLALEKHVTNQYWDELDCLRFAMLSRALREQGLSVASKAEWSKAIRAAEGQLDRLQGLQNASSRWRWAAESEEVLWLIVNGFPAQRAAVQALSDMLYLNGKTRALLTLMAKESGTFKTNLVYKSNLASLAMLLEAPEHKPHQLAREVFESNPEYAHGVAVFALSLLKQKKASEGVKVLQKLKPTALEDPTIAAYYGLCLAESGEKQEAEKYLLLAKKSKLLPEELKMIEVALHK